jgi:hypothetical protein
MTAIEEEALGFNTPLARALRCGTSFLDEPWSD